MPQHPNTTSAAATTSFSGLEPLEPRVLLTTFAFDPFAPVASWILHEFQPDRPAVSVAGAGDIDGDGHDDFAIGFPGEEETAGEVRIFSGRTLEVLRTLTDGSPSFGETLASPGDLTGDGVADLLVAAPAAFVPGTIPFEGGDGFVYLYSGADGSLVRTITTPNPGTGAVGDKFGFAFAVMPDLDGDDVADILIGAPIGGSSDRGEAYLLSGATGALLRTFTGEFGGDHFGYAVANAGDSSGPDRPADGVHDILIGAPAHDTGGLEDAGKAYLFDGVTGELLATFTDPEQGAQAGARLGHAVGSYDLAGNAAAESNGSWLLIGAPFYDFGSGTDNGVVISVRPDGASFTNPGWQSDWHEGERITNLGDFTRDGLRDAGVTRFQFPEVGGETYIAGRPVEGIITANAGDVDGDGFADLVSIMPGVGGENGTLRVFSSFRIADRGGASGASTNFEDVWFNSGQLLLTDGEYTAYKDVPGLRAGDQIRFINARGDIVGDTAGTDNSRPFIVIDGVRMDIREAITAVVGAEFTDGPIRARGLGEDGSVLIQQNVARPEAPFQDSWVFKDGVLTFLWAGGVTDINAAGTIIGTRLFGTTGVPPTFVRTADGETITIPGFAAHAIADDGVIVGTDAAGRLAFWENGEITSIGPTPGDSSNGPIEGYTRIDIASGRRVVATYVEQRFFGISRTPSPVIHHFYFEPELGLVDLAPRLADGPGSTSDVLAPDGRILSGTGIYAPIDDVELFRPAADSPVVPIIGAADITAVALNQFRTLVAFRRSTGAWEPITLTTGTNGSTFRLSDGDLFTAFLDHISGGVKIVRTGNNGTLILDADAKTIEQDLTTQSGGSRIVANLTLFSSTDGRVHLAGTNPDGEWVSFFQTGGLTTGVPNSVPIWSSGSITEQLDAFGLTVPTLTGVTSYVTPWDGLNIAGIDASGDIHTIWFAPGLPGWRTDNLSETARTAGRDVNPLSGQLAVYQTAWDGINIAGAVAAGDSSDVATLWWVPSFGGAWQFDSLSDLVDAPLVEPASLTAFTTPWGGLSIAAIAAEPSADIAAGDIVVFWWAPENGELPGNPSGWRLSSLHDAATTPTTTPPAAAGRLAAAVTPQGDQHLFATTTGDDASFITFTWTPGSGPAWTFTNLTAAAV